MKCDYCFKERQTLVVVHGYGCCDWQCGIKLYHIMQDFYNQWKLTQQNYPNGSRE